MRIQLNSRAMKLQQLYSAHEGATTSLSFHPSGNFLASGAGDSKVSVKMLILPPCHDLDTCNSGPNIPSVWFEDENFR